MKIKFNWGWGIAIFYGAFVIFSLVTVVVAMSLDSDMVTDDYYADDLKYQSHINKVNAANKLDHPMKIFTANNNLVIQFPEDHKNKEISGEVFLYRASDADQDKKIEIKVNDNNTQIIDVTSFSRGYWQIKVDWKLGEEEFYKVENLRL